MNLCLLNRLFNSLNPERGSSIFKYVVFKHFVVGDIKNRFWETTLNSLRPRQNDRHFADNTFRRIFLNENLWTLLKNSLKIVPKVGINNIPALTQIMAWRRRGHKPLSEPMMVSLPRRICVTWPQWVKWIPQNPIDDESTLVLVMSWCHQTTSYYLNQCWSSSMLPYIWCPWGSMG